jgi:hypothetical protein
LRISFQPGFQVHVLIVFREALIDKGNWFGLKPIQVTAKSAISQGSLQQEHLFVFTDFFYTVIFGRNWSWRNKWTFGYYTE